MKRLVQKYGWKTTAAIFAFYLVKDVTLYLLLPFFLLRSS